GGVLAHVEHAVDVELALEHRALGGRLDAADDLLGETGGARAPPDLVRKVDAAQNLVEGVTDESDLLADLDERVGELLLVADLEAELRRMRLHGLDPEREFEVDAVEGVVVEGIERTELRDALGNRFLLCETAPVLVF